MGKLTTISQNLEREYGLKITGKRAAEFIKTYNDYQWPISKRIEYFMDNTEELYNYILRRTDIPLYK